MDWSILFMFLFFGILLVLEVPIAFALAGSALLYLLVYPAVPLTIGLERENKLLSRYETLVMPEAEYEPSGWNDGFLFDYLDAIHQWRF